MDSAPACHAHLTPAEQVVVARARQRWDDLIEAAVTGGRTVPACWTWPVTEEDRQRAIDADWMGLWQAGRCACCGLADGAAVVDHDHETGWIRGLLCRSCNGREPGSTRRLFDRYRRHYPAKILGIWSRYCHPFYGLDYGRINGIPTVRALRVDVHGRVVVPPPLTSRDPSVLVGAALARGATP